MEILRILLAGALGWFLCAWGRWISRDVHFGDVTVEWFVGGLMVTFGFALEFWATHRWLCFFELWGYKT